MNSFGVSVVILYLNGNSSQNISKVQMKDRTDFGLFPKFRVPINLVSKISLVEGGKFVKFWRHICFKIWVSECFLLPLCQRSPSTSPLDGLYPINWTNVPPKSTHPQQLLIKTTLLPRKKHLMTSYGKQIWRQNWTHFPTGDIFLTKLIGTRKLWE